MIRNSVCTKDIELLSVSFRPFYLPREFGQLFFTLVYIPPDANTKNACSVIMENTHKLDDLSVDSPKFILGDFNACTLKDSLPSYFQYVKCQTRLSKTIDLCYGNIRNAYKSLAKPPLGGSDHNTIFLMPCYRQKLKTVKPETKSIKQWSTGSIETLRGCFDLTDWGVFEEACGTVDELTETVTDYINFCVETVIPSKTVKIFANNKPWVSKELKTVVNEKKRAFYSEDRAKVKVVQRQINNEIKRCKIQF